MSAICALQSSRFYKTRLIATSLIALAWCSEAVAQTVNVPPPQKYILDENGVNLANGNIVVPRVDVAIGPKEDPLQLVNYSGSQQFNNFGLNVYNGVPMIIGPNGPVSASTTGANGETLTNSGGIYTLILGDGTKYVYGNTDMTTYDAIVGTGFNARITEITYPNGQKLNFFYKKATYICPNSFCASTGGTTETKVRLQSVTRSDGYAIKLSYKSNLTSTGQQQTDWSSIQSAVGFNRANEYCNPTVDTCSFTLQWPSASYATNVVNGTSVFAITTAEGTHQYWGNFDANGWYNYYQRPGATTFSRKDSYGYGPNFTAGLTSILNAGVTTQYSWNLVQSGFWPIVNTMTLTRTNPDQSTRIVVTDQGVGVPSSITDEVNGVYNFTYDTNARLTQATSPEGRSTIYAYDTRGNITSVTNTAKPGSGLANLVSTASFSATCANVFTCNQPIWTKDALGNQTDYTYNGTHGGVVTITAPADVSGVRPQTRYTYAAKQAYFKGSTGTIVASGVPTYLNTAVSNCLTATSANPASCVGTSMEKKTTYNHGPQTAGTANNLLPVGETLASGDGSLSATNTSTFDRIGNWTSEDGPLTGTVDTTVYRYDAAQRMVGIVKPDPDGAGTRTPTAQRMTYNPDSQVTLAETGTVTDQSDTAWAAFNSQQQVFNVYDTNARLSQSKVNSGGVTQTVTHVSHDASGRVKCQAVRMDSAQWNSQTDACVAQLTGPNGPDRIEQKSYDGIGRVAAITTGVGTPEAAVVEARTYTADGMLASVKDGENNLTSYEYDGFDRKAVTRYPVTTAGAAASSASDYEQLSYNANSSVMQKRLRDGTIVTNSYDNLGRLTSSAPTGDASVSYQYNLLDQTTQSVNSIGASSVSVAYDALGRVVTETQPFGSAAYQYDIAGRRTRLTWADGFYVTYDYDNTGKVTAIRENGAASGIGVLASYSYDNLGRRTGITRGNGASTSYTFDPVSRLQSTTQDLAGSANDQTIGSINYNPDNQIVSQVRSNDAYAWSGHYNVNRNYTANGLNQQTAAGATALSYDARGNLTSSGASLFTYDKRNMMLSAPGGTMGYDGTGRMTKYNSASGTLRLAYAGSALIQETNGPGGAILRRYVPGPGVDETAVWYEGATTADRRWLHADERGSVIAVSDGSGAMLGINRYDEYGIPQAGNVGRFQYTGQAWLPEIGLYNYKARIYSPTLGRFMQTDPIGYGDGLNWYNYVHSDPINGTDPTGTEEGGGQQTIVVTGSVIRLSLGDAPGIGFSPGGIAANISSAINIPSISTSGTRAGWAKGKAKPAKPAKPRKPVSEEEAKRQFQRDLQTARCLATAAAFVVLVVTTDGLALIFLAGVAADIECIGAMGD